MKFFAFLQHCRRGKVGKALLLLSIFPILYAMMLVTSQAEPTAANSVTTPTRQPDLSAEYAEGRVLIKLKPSLRAQEQQSLRTQMGARRMKSFSLISTEVWELEGMTVAEAIKEYADHPMIEYIEPDYIVSTLDTFPNDPDFSEMWGLHNTGQSGGTADADIDAPEAWDVTTGGNVLIGVIDSGVDYTHPDLAANMWTNPGEIPGNSVDDDGNGFIADRHGYDFNGFGDSDPFDEDGHGTHVAGTIAAVGNNGVGVTGVNWSARIMALKAIPGRVSEACDALEYAIMMGAQLTNNSWGSLTCSLSFSQTLYNMIQQAGNAGQLFVAAAGNCGNDTDIDPNYPASFDLDNIIAVAATDRNDQLASFSNFGATSVDLSAPGVAIESTFPGNTYGPNSGTSMATPHVAGVAGLVIAAKPQLTHLQVKEAILGSVDPVPALQGKTVTGGRLNAVQALGVEPLPPTPCFPPASGDWVITTSCTFSGTALAPGNVIVQNNAALFIAPGAFLDLDFSSKHLRIRDGSKVVIKHTGKID